MTEPYRSGFLSKCAELGISRHKARAMCKMAEFEKRADPPNRGIHDPNPAKRAVYRKYGYIPQDPVSYMPDPFFTRDFDSDDDTMWDVMDTAFGAIDGLPPNRQKAAIFDYIRSAGSMVNRFIPGTSNSPPAIVVGSYPTGNETAFRHELGHSLDDSFSDEDRVDPKAALLQEERAWDLAGIPKGHPVREAALDSYRAYARGNVSAPEIRRGMKNYWNASIPFYSPPSEWLSRQTNSTTPLVVHDMPSAERAVAAGVQLPGVGEFNDGN